MFKNYHLAFRSLSRYLVANKRGISSQKCRLYDNVTRRAMTRLVDKAVWQWWWKTNVDCASKDLRLNPVVLYARALPRQLCQSSLLRSSVRTKRARAVESTWTNFEKWAIGNWIKKNKKKRREKKRERQRSRLSASEQSLMRDNTSLLSKFLNQD